MDEAELQEILDLLEDADEAWLVDNRSRCVNKQNFTFCETDRQRFSALVKCLVAAQRQSRATVDLP
jgi:hypothetical protein